MTPHPATARPKVVVRSPEWYGWSPDLPDHRDKVYSAPLARLGPLAPRVDLRAKGDQDPFVPSRLFIYYNERAMEGTIDEDWGAQIRDGIKSVRLTRDLRQGYFTMPFAYLLDADLSDDFWTIRLVQ